MNSDSFCIDIGEKFTRVTDILYKKNKILIQSAGFQNTVSDYYSDDTEKSIASEAEVISKLYADLKLSKRTVNLIIPDTYCYSHIMELSILNEKELMSAVRYQADQFIPVPLDEVILDIEVISIDKVNKKNSILVVACPKRLVERAEKLCEMLSLMPVSLENELSGIGRLLSEVFRKQTDQSYILVNFGFTTTSFYLVDGKSSLILMTHSIKLGFDLFVKEVMFNLEASEVKSIELLKSIGFTENASYDLGATSASIVRELVNELSKFIILTKDKYNLNVESMHLFNYAHLILLFDQKISNLLQIPVSLFTLSDVFEKNPVSVSYGKDITSFIGSIAGNLR